MGDYYDHEERFRIRQVEALEDLVGKLDAISDQLSRIGVSQGPCDSIMYSRNREVLPSVFDGEYFHCHLNALHTGLHQTKGGRTWTEEQAMTPIQKKEVFECE